MSEKPISPLRRRMIEDMTVRNFVEKTHHDYIRHVRTFTAFLGRAPDTAAPEIFAFSSCIRRRPALVRRASMARFAALRFFFTVTLDRPEMARHLTFVREPRKIPVILSLEEIARLLEAAPGRSYKGRAERRLWCRTAGLRSRWALKVSDIDSERMLLRIEQGKGRKDPLCNAFPAAIGVAARLVSHRPARGLAVPGRDPLLPLTTRQFNRAVHAAADRAAIKKPVTPHTLRHSFCHPPARRENRCALIQVLLGHARLDTTALYCAGGHQRDPRGHEPVGSAHAADIGEEAAVISHDHGSSRPGDRGYLPRPWLGMAQANAGHVSLGQFEGNVGDRELPHGGSRRPCHALRGLLAHAVAYNSCRNRHCPKCQGSQALAWMKQRKSELLDVPYFHVVFTLPARIAAIAYQNKAVVYDLLFKASSQTMRTIAADPKRLGVKIGFTLCPMQRREIGLERGLAGEVGVVAEELQAAGVACGEQHLQHQAAETARQTFTGKR